MKLNDFFKKSPRERRLPTKFVLQNDTEASKYKSQIDDLNTQLGYYRTIEAQRDEAITRLTHERETFQEGRREMIKLEQRLLDAQSLTEHNQKQLIQIPELEEAVQAAKGNYSQINNELQNLTKVAFEQSKNLSLVKAQVDSLRDENQKLALEEKQARADKISAVEELTTVFTENTQLKNFTEETSKINSNLKNEIKEVKDVAMFWESESNEATVQLKESMEVGQQLRKWITDLEVQTSQAAVSKGKLDEEKHTLQGTIQEMGSVMEDLIKEMTYLRTLNKEYRKELSKSRFMSMGAIARREGFIMPTGKENLRKHYLGNAAPTLLKFKAREEISNAR
jgi:chromosome segregation ATPase